MIERPSQQARANSIKDELAKISENMPLLRGTMHFAPVMGQMNVGQAMLFGLEPHDVDVPQRVVLEGGGQ